MATLSKDKTYVTVVKGDTLSEIAQAYGSYIAGSGIYGSNGKLETLKKINDIENVNYIVVGQKIMLTGSSSAKKNTSSTPTIKVFGVQSNSGGRTMYATWTWSKSNTENYQTIWQYDTGDGVWFNGSDSTTTDKQSLYTAPNNAVRVRFKVKPISKKRKVNGKETAYWTASWSTIKTYSFSANPPVTPSGLSASIDGVKLTATLSNVDTSVDGINATEVQFRIYRIVDGTNKLFSTSGNLKIVNKYVSYTCDLTAGYKYFVTCRAVRGTLYSDWSEMVDAGETNPAVPKIVKCKATKSTEVYLEWTKINTADSYTVEYTTDKTKFDASDDVQSQDVNTGNFWYFSFTSDETGQEWFFRVRAKNSGGDSKWSAITSVVMGDTPNAPTTWSSTTTAIVDDEDMVTLYWLHNATDDSDPTKAQLKMTVTKNGKSDTAIFEMNYETGRSSEVESDETEDDNGFFGFLSGLFSTKAKDDTESDKENEEKTPDSYSIQSANLGGGVTIEWCVRTAGATKLYGEWSVTRVVEIYNRPVIYPFHVTDYEGATVETLTQFPINIEAITTKDDNQFPIGYHLAVISNGDYETVDDVGTVKSVRAGDGVYHKYFDITDMLEVELSAKDMDLENNIEYTIKCVAAMSSGLNCEASHNFTVAWTDEQYEPNAEISYDPNTVSVSIRPHCENEDGDLIQGVLLSVYRREFDGTFTELAKDIDNNGYTYVTDPHPALDYARYRIVAKSTVTGAISSYDIPGYPVGEKAVIIQWAESWSNFDASMSEDANGQYMIEDTRSEAVWTGSMLRLPYNIDVSESNTPDVVMVNYIGRKHPVSYYGTSIGTTATWSVTVDKSDKDTLYALRRLAVWMGDVYLREPSGCGYWANVTVSFSQNHCETTIPVSLNITRVEGGV